MKSTSAININGDLKQSKITLLIYLLINFFQNIFFTFFIRQFSYIRFKPQKKKYNLKNNQSISRKLCGIYWKNVNWNRIYKHIGKFNICEIGTGDGDYFRKDVAINKNYIDKYTGYDVKRFGNWKKNLKKNFLYKKFNGQDFHKIINYKNNLFLSQSCLEHVKYDLDYFYEIKKKSIKTKNKIIMMHCVPNSFCLFTYLAHGFRQYNIENLNKISKIVGTDNSYVIKLGNLRLNIEHLKKTTFPLIFKKKNLMLNQNNHYYKKLNKKLIEVNNPSFFMSSFVIYVGLMNFDTIEKKKLINNFLN